MRGRQAGDAQIDFTPAGVNGGPAILGHALLGDVQIGHDFDPRDHRRLHRFGHQHVLVENPVDAHPDAHGSFLRLEMNVAGPERHSPGNDLVHQTDDRRIHAHVGGIDLARSARNLGVIEDLFVHGLLDRLFDRTAGAIV